MNLAVTLLLGAVLLLAPCLAAIPDEPMWSSWLSAGTLLAVVFAVIAARRGSPVFSRQTSRAEQAFLVLLGLAFLSIPARLAVQHHMGFLGMMLRGWTLLATDFALFALARRVAANRSCLYGLVIVGIVGSGIVADLGVQEYAMHLRAGEPSWRIFGTSTPDYLAGYFVMLLPVTLALFLQVSALRGIPPLLASLAALIPGVVILFQLIALLTTGSRFALLSLLAGFFVFGLSLALGMRHGLVLSKATRGLLGMIGVGLVLAGAVFARPVIARLHTINDNSAAFRKWTWKGSVKMAAANPVLGTGIGTWPDLYPRYALTGFTRLAHNSYLQIADECGIPALLALLATLGLLGNSLARGLRLAPAAPAEVGVALPLPRRRKPTPSAVLSPSDVLPTDSRLLLYGLAGALAGGAVQNLIDSDWYVFFLGATFWTLAGLAAGIASPAPIENAPQKAPLPVALAVGGVAAALFAFIAAQGIAAGYGAQDYGAARAWDPLNGKYASDQGYKVFYLHDDKPPEAETALHTAIALEPNSVNFRRLGTVLQMGGRQDEALNAYEAGLRAEPNSLDLLLNLARLSPAPANLAYYRRLSDLELTPVGTVSALGDATETRFVFGDVVMGDEAAKTNPAAAISYYARAARRLEAFADEGGSMNEQRQALSGGHPDPRLDTSMHGLYLHALDAWIALAPGDISLKKRRQQYSAKFDGVLEKSSKSGNI